MKLLLIFSILFMAAPIFSSSISLNGEWSFAIDSTAEYDVNNTPSEWRKIIVPGSWQSQFEDLRDYQGIAWYKKMFTSPSKKPTDRVLLSFNAVDYIADVYINKKSAGKHEGGYTPFSFDITDLINKGNNEILIRVMDPAANEKGTEGISYWNIPHGKQSWYVQTSGLWQNVQLLVKPETYIQSLLITPSIDGKIIFNISFNSAPSEPVNIKITDPYGKLVLNDNLKELSANITVEKSIANPQLWSFNSPKLYSVQIKAGEDIYSDKFGFRSIEARDGRLYLNGEPFYLIGALDQDFYPETMYTTPSEDYVKEEMLKAKEMGLNLLRCHIKAPDPVYLKAADEIGVLIWYEIPNWDVFTFEAAKRGSYTLDEMLMRDWNHPSLVILSLINESWGIDLQKEEQRKWLLNEFNRIKVKAIGRLVVDNSACWGNFHIKTDIADYHTYSAIPEDMKGFNTTVNDLSKRPDWLFSKLGDSLETGKEPLLLSEFGNWGLPKLPEKLPWWINRKFLDIEVSLPAGFEDRFRTYKYNQIFASYNDLAEESQKAQYNALKYEIETIRLKPELSGYVITEFTDINWESNGLLDMYRNYKEGSKKLRNIQQQDVIIPRVDKYTYSTGDTIKISLFISHFSKKEFRGLKLKWEMKNMTGGSIEVPYIKRGEVQELSPLKINIPQSLNQSQKITFNFTLSDNKNSDLASNYLDVFFLKEELTTESHSQIPEINIYDSSGTLEITKIKEDYQVSPSASTIITNKFNSDVLSLLSEGKNVICFIDSNTTFPAEFPYQLKSRNDAWYDGNWASNLNWIRNNNDLFSDVSFGKTFGFEMAECAPKYVITGIPGDSFDNVLAGMYIGWIHLNSGYIVQMKVKQGNLVLCTFPVLNGYEKDTFSKKLFSNLIKYINGKDFNPKLTWSYK